MRVETLSSLAGRGAERSLISQSRLTVITEFLCSRVTLLHTQTASSSHNSSPYDSLLYRTDHVIESESGTEAEFVHFIMENAFIEH